MIEIEIYRKDTVRSMESLKMQRTSDDAKVRFNEFGKPIVTCGNRFMNKSHSGEYIAYGYSDDNIGIDLQKYKNKTKDYIQYVTGKPDTDIEEFIRIWVIKESFVKWLGTGWAKYEPQDIMIDFNNQIVMVSEYKAFYKVFKLFKQYMIAVCCEFRPEIERIIIYG